MKGVILAGGTGSRLWPLTKKINKHFLPIYNRPMIYYPLQTLIDSGIKEIMIITNPEYLNDFEEQLHHEFGIQTQITFQAQPQPKGIANALSQAESFANGDNLAVILGDNIFTENFLLSTQNFNHGAHVFLKEVPDPERYGIAELKHNQIIEIIEKPKYPKSNKAVTGLFLYDKQVFEIIQKITPSTRDELEITDVNNQYIAANNMNYSLVEEFWTDAGTFESLLEAGQFMREKTLNKCF
jgi:glucose-1-phosphate thymidylyltransferase